jgi:hypothetical protein
MKVHVRLMRYCGQNLKAPELKALPPRAGILEVSEQRDTDLGRSTVRARLLDEATRNDVLPELKSATLLWAQGSVMRLTGVEQIDRCDYAQTWTVEVQPCSA